MSDKKPTIWGDLGLLFIIGVLFVLSLYVLHRTGALPPMNLVDWAIVGGALLSIGLSTLFSSFASDGHAYHRLGFELCGLSLGTCLSLLVAKSMSGAAALPELGQALGFYLTHEQQVGVVSIAGFVSVFCLALTAFIVRTVDSKAPVQWRAGLSAISFLVGVLLLFVYVTLLVGAGA